MPDARAPGPSRHRVPQVRSGSVTRLKISPITAQPWVRRYSLYPFEMIDHFLPSEMPHEALIEIKVPVMASRMLNLQGKRALIFGVASEESIAWAIAKQLHAAGATISLGYRQRFKSRILQLVRGGDIPVEFYERCDVTNEEELDNFFAAYDNDIDILVHSIAYANPETFAQPISGVSQSHFAEALVTSSYSLSAVGSKSPPAPDARRIGHDDDLPRRPTRGGQLQADGSCEGRSGSSGS